MSDSWREKINKKQADDALELSTPHETSSKKKTDIFCCFFPQSCPLLSHIITVLSAPEQKVTLLKTSARGANLQSVSEAPHDKTQVSVKKSKVSEWSMDRKGTDHHWRGHLVGRVINPAEWLAWKLLAPHAPVQPHPSNLWGTQRWWSVKPTLVTLIRAGVHRCDPAGRPRLQDRIGGEGGGRDRNKASRYCDKISGVYDMVQHLKHERVAAKYKAAQITGVHTHIDYSSLDLFLQLREANLSDLSKVGANQSPSQCPFFAGPPVGDVAVTGNRLRWVLAWASCW